MESDGTKRPDKGLHKRRNNRGLNGTIQSCRITHFNSVDGVIKNSRHRYKNGLSVPMTAGKGRFHTNAVHNFEPSSRVEGVTKFNANLTVSYLYQYKMIILTNFGSKVNGSKFHF